MDALNITLIAVGGLTVGLGLVSAGIAKSCVSAPMIALSVGVAIGPAGLGWLSPEDLASVTGDDSRLFLEQASRLTLAIGLLGVALRLTTGAIFRRWRTLAVLILVVMPLTGLIGGGLFVCLLGLPPLVALAAGMACCPTDPVVASTIVTGPVARANLSLRLRRLISAESGANDGLAYPLVFLPLLLSEHSPAASAQIWLSRVMLWEIAAAVAIGWGIGMIAGRLLKLSERQHEIGQRSLLGFTVALTLLTLGIAAGLKTDGVLAVFVAGLAFDRQIDQSDRLREERFQEAVNQFFALPVFLFIGIFLPWDGWSQWHPATLLATVVGVLFLRRLPLLLAAVRLGWLPAMPRWGDAWFAGWFGPVGVAAVFYAAIADGQLGGQSVWNAVSLAVVGSVIAHGVTATPLVRWHRRRRRQGRGHAATFGHDVKAAGTS